ncbi:MAG: DUF2264 domain-containing protein [Candidatus Glassbacteria bacterium]
MPAGFYRGGTIVRGAVLALLVGVSAPAAAAKEGPQPARAGLEAALDFTRSPYTGYTRAHWIEISQKIIGGILPYFSAESGMPELVGDPRETGHFAHLFDVGGSKEAFDRSLFLVAVYTSATGSDRIPGWKGSIVEPYLKEVRRGTDRNSLHFWGDHPKYDVFGTSLAMAINISPEYFWEPLTPEEKKNVLAYLKDLAYNQAYDCNHWQFHQIAVPVLEHRGVDSNREFLTAMFQRLMGWYRGDGWFIDGGNRSFDLYNFWAFQLYNHALTRFYEPWHDRFGEFVRRTTGEFFESYPYFFGRDGAHIAWGRSTTYRFASIAPVGWSVLDGTCTLAPGQARRIASGCLKYFWERGALSERGLLEPGFLGPNTVVAEPYIDRGAPYWAVQGLVSLLVPEDDPFWTDPELPMPADQAGGRRALPAAQMLVKVSPIDGEARLYPVGQPFSHWGQWQRGIKYCQYAYSSYLGWVCTGEGGPDLGAGRNGTSPDGENWHYRERPRAIRVTEDHLVSEESIPEVDLEKADTTWYDFGEVITHTLVGNSGEVHVFWHNCGRPLFLHLGGYGISVPHGQELKAEEEESRLTIHGGDNHSTMKVIQAPPGSLRWELVKPRPGWLHSHNQGGRGAFPYWRSARAVPSNTPVVIYVDGTRGRQPVDPPVTVTVYGPEMQVTFEGVTHEIRIPY